MKIASLNPLKLARKGINGAIDKLQQSADPTGSPGSSLAPMQPQAPEVIDGEPVTGVFVPTATTIQVGNAASMHTEQFRRIVNSFDEDKQTLLALVVSKFFMVLAYLAPLILGFFAGAAIGDTIAGTFTLAHATNVFYHLISIALELCIPMLGYAVAVSFKRAAKDRSQVTLCAVLGVLFICLAIGNALAQDVLLYHGLPQATADEQVSIWFRSFGPSIVDVLATVFLAVVGVRSLKKYLADQREKIAAVKEVNAVHIDMDKATLQAEIDKQTAIMEMQSKQQRATTWNEIEKLQSEAMIDQARRNMRGDVDGGSYRRSRY